MVFHLFEVLGGHFHDVASLAAADDHDSHHFHIDGASGSHGSHDAVAFLTTPQVSRPSGRTLRWQDVLGSFSQDTVDHHRSTALSFLSSSESPDKLVNSSDAGSDGHNSEEHDTSDGMNAYNPANRVRFMVAMPLVASLAMLFECMKGRVAETNLQAPLPKVVHSAKQEGEVSSISRAMQILTPYISGPTGLKAAAYATAHVSLMGIGLYVDLTLMNWNGVFWTALQAHKAQRFYSLLWDFVIITGVSVFIGTYNTYLTGMWHLHARDHLTRHFSQIWIGGGAMCVMQQNEAQLDNPDQRIAEDVDEFVGSSRELFFGALSASVGLCVYGPMLVKTSPPVLLGFVMAWPVFGAITTHCLGSSLVPLTAASQCSQADFRSELVYVRDNADSLAMMGAGPHVQDTLQGRFEVVKRVVYAEMDVAKVLGFFKTIFEEYGNVVPLVLLAPAYFNGSINLGTLMQLRMVVQRVSGSLTFPVSAYEQAVEWRAATNRLVALQVQAREASIAVKDIQEGLLPFNGDDAAASDRLQADSVSVLTPEGRELICNFSLCMRAGDRVLVTGPASRGKSLLVRTLAGLWSHTSGKVRRPDNCMFVQGFEFPLLTLQGLLAYPGTATADAELFLKLVGASSLCDDSIGAEVVRNWSEILTVEQQERVQIARVLYQQPRFVILDEPLASLDVAAAGSLLELLPKEMAVLILSRRHLGSFENVINLADVDSSWTEGSAESVQPPLAMPASRSLQRGLRPVRRGQPMHQGATKVVGVAGSSQLMSGVTVEEMREQ